MAYWPVADSVAGTQLEWGCSMRLEEFAVSMYSACAPYHEGFRHDHITVRAINIELLTTISYLEVGYCCLCELRLLKFTRMNGVDDCTGVPDAHTLSNPVLATCPAYSSNSSSSG